MLRSLGQIDEGWLLLLIKLNYCAPLILNDNLSARQTDHNNPCGHKAYVNPNN